MKYIKIICFFLISISVLGQNYANEDSVNQESWTKVDLRRTVQLEDDSKPFEVIINIKTNVQRFEFMITSSVRSGKLSIEVFDPSGIRRGNFSVGTQLNSKIEETATGNIKKSLFEPQPGDWKIKMIPTDGTGTIRIGTALREY